MCREEQDNSKDSRGACLHDLDTAAPNRATGGQILLEACLSLHDEMMMVEKRAFLCKGFREPADL